MLDWRNWRENRRGDARNRCRARFVFNNNSFPHYGVKPQEKTETSWKPEVIEVAPPPVSKELKRRWSHFIRKVYEADPLTCPKCQGEMRIISFIDQPDVIKKILQHLGLWEESHAPPEKSQRKKEITFDPSYSQLI